MTKYIERLAAPEALLGVEGGEHYGLVVDGGGVAVDGGGGLGAEVAVAEVEVEGADVVGAMGAGELHASLDAGDGVEAFHRIQSSLFVGKGKTRGWGGEGNAGCECEEVLIVGMGAQNLASRLKFLARAQVAPACEGSFDCGCPSRLGREGQSSLRMTNREGDESLKKSLCEPVVLL
jgi:hypothetical protein